MSLLTDTHWVATLHINIVRVLSATITLAVLYPIGRMIGLVNSNADFLSVFVIPFGLLLFGLAGILFFRLAGSMGVPFMQPCEGLLALMMIVFIAVGDPLIWFARKYFPNIVPSKDFRIINPRAVILVQKEAA